MPLNHVRNWYKSLYHGFQVCSLLGQLLMLKSEQEGEDAQLRQKKNPGTSYNRSAGRSGPGKPELQPLATQAPKPSARPGLLCAAKHRIKGLRSSAPEGTKTSMARNRQMAARGSYQHCTCPVKQAELGRSGHVPPNERLVRKGPHPGGPEMTAGATGLAQHLRSAGQKRKMSLQSQHSIGKVLCEGVTLASRALSRSGTAQKAMMPQRPDGTKEAPSPQPGPPVGAGRAWGDRSTGFGFPGQELHSEPPSRLQELG